MFTSLLSLHFHLLTTEISHPCDRDSDRYELHGNTGGFQAFSIGMTDVATNPTVLYTFTPPLLPGTYSVSVSVNANSFWPPMNYQPTRSGCFVNAINHQFGGDCVDLTATCRGRLIPQGSPDCAACCIAESTILVYPEFDITPIASKSTFEGFSSGEALDEDGTGPVTPRPKQDVGVAFGDKQLFVDPALVCCFYYAPRDPNTARPLVDVKLATDLYADRSLRLPPLSGNFGDMFPRQSPSDSPFKKICGESHAVLKSATLAACGAPPLPVRIKTK